MDVEAFALQGRLNSTVERMKRNGESEDEIRKGEKRNPVHKST